MDLKDIFGEKSPTFIGVIMAVVGSSFIGLSYTASKTAHNKSLKSLRDQMDGVISTDDEQSRLDDIFNDDSADDNHIPIEDDDETSPLLQYSMSDTMKHAEWWISIILLLSGEIFNFMAYGFAPTSVIAPLGTLSIISGAVSGYFYLGERIKARNVLGMIISILGATIIVIFARSEEPKLSPEAIMKALSQIRFLIYLAVTTGLIVVLMILDKTKMKGTTSTFGDKFMVIRVSLTALFSGFTVLSTKSISSLLSLTLYRMFGYWISYVLILVLLVNALFTLYYTNKALSTFDSTSVLPAEFAAFTFSAVLGSAMLYNDFDHATILDISMFFIGCLITFIGVYLITTGNDKQGKPVNNRASTLVPSTILSPDNPRRSFVSTSRPLTHPVADYTDTTIPRTRHSELFSPHRISQNGLAGLISMLNALGNTRASLSFQQVVLPGKKQPQDVMVFPHSPDSPMLRAFDQLHQSINPDWGFEIVPTKTESDEVAFFVRPISSRVSLATNNNNEDSPQVPELGDASSSSEPGKQPGEGEEPKKFETRRKRLSSLFRKKSSKK